MINNKGLTAIELLICFSLVSVITIAMFQTINSYKNKQDIESFKSSITTYKTTLTKEIYTDIINNFGIVSTSYSGGEVINPDDIYKSIDFTYTLTLNFKSGVTKQLEVRSKARCFENKRDNEGNKDCVCTEYDSNGLCKNVSDFDIDNKHSEFYVKYNGEIYDLPKIDGLKYNSIVTEEKDDGFISIHIGLWHSEYGTEYDALNVIVPNVNKYPGMF